LLSVQRRIELLARQAQTHGLTHLKETRPLSLDFRDANLRTVLDAVTRSSGINFILDKDLKIDSRVTIFLHGASVEDAIDLITSTNQLSRKMVDDQTMLIYPNTPEKQRDYQELLVRVFYLSSTEAKGAAAFLKSMLKIREPFVDEKSNVLALRDTPENIELAERLLSLYDNADPEVMLQLDVMEVTSTELSDLGLQIPSSVTLAAVAPNSASSLTLGNIKSLTRNDISVAVGSLVLNFERQIGDTRLLANPSLRVRSREKAKIMVGDKVPVITTTASSTGFASDSVSYLDVGLKLDVQPTVYADDDVAIKIGLEVSSVTSQVTSSNGTVAYQIGTRNAETELRLHDGETQMLGGLIKRNEQSTSNRIPGLGDLPIAGRLFSNQLDNGTHTELVLAVTPHIVRNVRRPDASESELWVGTESAPHLRAVRASAASSAASTSQPGTIGPAAAASANTTSAAMVSVGQRDSTAGAPSATVSTLRLDGPAKSKVGESFRVAVALDAHAGLRGLPMQFVYNKSLLSLEAVEEGSYFNRDGEKTSFTQVIQADDGVARAGVLRTSSTAATGQGIVYTLKFKALKPGVASVGVTNADPAALGVDAAVALPLPLSVTVQ